MDKRRRVKSKRAGRGTAGRVPYKFAWKEGSRLKGRLSPLTFGPIIVRYLKLYKQRLAAEKLLEEATPPDSILHAAFNWDDASAAHQHRLAQSRHLLRSLDYVFDTPEGELKGRATTITERNMQPGKYFYSLIQPAEVLKSAMEDCENSVRRSADQLESLMVRCPQVREMVPILDLAIKQMREAAPKPSPKPAPKSKTKAKKAEKGTGEDEKDLC
jgi:hypothetical protein